MLYSCIQIELATCIVHVYISEWSHTPSGAPQGTKLGPWLFIAMIDDLQVPTADGLYKYVDDTTTYEVVRKNLASQTQIIVDEISRWSSLTKFQLHPKKCRKLRISFSPLSTNREPVHIDKTIVELVTSAKTLGVHFQNNLKWNSHIDATVKKLPRDFISLSNFM